MELTLKKIEKLDPNKIYNLLLPNIKEIYELYNYLNIIESDYHKLVLKEIINSQKNYPDNQDYFEYLQKKIKSQLSDKTKKLLNNPKTSFTLINNYLNQKFLNISNYYKIF